MPLPETPAPTVEYVRPEVTEAAKDWKFMRDIFKGSRAIKDAGTEYLPMPNADDQSQGNQLAYQAYKQRAMLYPVTQRTGIGMVGEVLQKEPQVELPNEMDVMRTNMDGAGNTVAQFLRNMLYELWCVGRVGILSDYPMNAGTVTLADLEAKKVQTTVKLYKAENIINWQQEVIGARLTTTLVVLLENHTVKNGPFGYTAVKKYRVLTLENGVVKVELWHKAEGATAYTVETSALLLDVTGAPFTEIPFAIAGAENNDWLPNTPPLLGMAVLNIGHYRNSADVEQSAYICGQPTLVVSGMTKEWLEKQLGGVIRIGSRAGLPLPPNCTADILQCEANNLPKELMAEKERQMVALGAKLVEQKEVQRTATEAGQEEASTLSVVSTIVRNANVALAAVLKACAKFIVNRELKEGDDPELVCEISTDFRMSRMSSADRAQLIAEWMAGAIDFEEMRSGLKEAGVAFKDDTDVQAAVQEELAARALNMPDQNGNGGNQPPKKNGTKDPKKEDPTA